MNALDTPILFLVFNRPDKTRQVFETIRKAKPKQLFVAADGPRENLEAEDKVCQKVRTIATNIDWDCEIKTLFRTQNLGCGKAVSEAITWFFTHVEKGIILEDDCLCDESFFCYATDLLDKYEDDHNVMHIGAHGPLVKLNLNTDYSFIRYPLVWGWASWRRAWVHYDYNINEWPTEGSSILNLNFGNSLLQLNYWSEVFNRVYKGEIDTWDYQWAFACMKNYGFSIFPHTNLVKNIGFSVNATHTTDCKHIRSNMTTGCIQVPMTHPEEIGLNSDANKLVEKEIFELSKSQPAVKSTLPSKIKTKLKKALTIINFRKDNSVLIKDHKLLIKRKVFDCLVNDFIWVLLPNFLKENRHFTFRRKDFSIRHDIKNIKFYFKDLTVKNGIFKGLMYAQNKSYGSAFYPKLLGTYEIEIQSSLARLLRENYYNNIIDIGCAEGYYLGGIGLICTNSHLYGVDISNQALDLTEQLLLYNGIRENRFTLSNTFDFKNINKQSKNLVVIDCEGYEYKFIKNIDRNYLINCDFLIECHDCFTPFITNKIIGLLQDTHIIDVIYSTNDELKFKFLPEDLEINNFYEKLRLVNEERGSIMNWIIAKAKLN